MQPFSPFRKARNSSSGREASPRNPGAQAANDARMPWPVTVATFIGIFSFYLASGFLPLMALFAVAILASYLTSARLEGNTQLRWWVRLAGLCLVLMLNQEEPRFGEGVGSVKSRNMFAQVYMLEVAIQCWRRRFDDPNRSSMIALLCAGMLFLTASNTFDPDHIRYLAPAFLFFALLGFLRYRPRVMTRRALIWQGAALIAALAIGGIGYRVIYVNKDSLTQVSNRFMLDRFPMMEIGMASQPTLGSLFGLRGSPARMLRIENPAGDRHLRGMAFDHYQLGRWSPTYQEREYKPAGDALTPLDADRILNSRDMTITRLMGRNPLVYAPLEAIRVDKGDADEVDWAPATGGPIRAAARAPYEYIVTVAPRIGHQGLLATPLDSVPGYREKCLQLPPRLNQGVRQLARTITRTASTDVEKIEQVTSYLITTHPYSLRYQRGPGDPLSDFLLSEPKKGAHCEFFGSAAAVLLRCVGVPTRYVTGYYAHESGGPNTVIVRQRDAHAWCEAWVEGTGWVTVDATPGDGRPDELATEIEWWRKLVEWFQDAYKAVTDWLGDRDETQVNIAIGVVFVLGLTYGLVNYLRRRGSRLEESVFAYSPPEAALLALITRFEAAFARRGVPFPPARTYGEHLATLSEAPQAALVPPARRFLAAYDAARFGGRWDESVRTTLEESLKEIETLPE